jgi:hypothetical protein
MDQPIFWYSRTIFTVTNLEDAIDYYTHRLNFEEQWRQGDTIAQVNRNGVEIILNCNETTPLGGGRVLVVLNLDLLHELRDELNLNEVDNSIISVPWFALVVKDIDGNELWFQDTSSFA